MTVGKTDKNSGLPENSKSQQARFAFWVTAPNIIRAYFTNNLEEQSLIKQKFFKETLGQYSHKNIDVEGLSSEVVMVFETLAKTLAKQVDRIAANGFITYSQNVSQNHMQLLTRLINLQQQLNTWIKNDPDRSSATYTQEENLQLNAFKGNIEKIKQEYVSGSSSKKVTQKVRMIAGPGETQRMKRSVSGGPGLSGRTPDASNLARPNVNPADTVIFDARQVEEIADNSRPQEAHILLPNYNNEIQIEEMSRKDFFAAQQIWLGRCVNKKDPRRIIIHKDEGGAVKPFDDSDEKILNPSIAFNSRSVSKNQATLYITPEGRMALKNGYCEFGPSQDDVAHQTKYSIRGGPEVVLDVGQGKRFNMPVYLKPDNDIKFSLTSWKISLGEDGILRIKDPVISTKGDHIQREFYFAFCKNSRKLVELRRNADPDTGAVVYYIKSP